MEAPQLVPVHMVLGNLDAAPRYVLPAPFRVRFYQRGDIETWVRVESDAEEYRSISRDLHEREFGRDHAVLSERQCFLCDGEGRAIGTATAWFNDEYEGQRWGRVHWVAVVRRMQGRGLGKPLLSAVIDRLRELGHSRAYLITETVRVPAICLYLKFGFVPRVRDSQDRAAWLSLKRQGLDLDLPPGPDETL
jgi:GNAT superfamily N-acetyltransferase